MLSSAIPNSLMFAIVPLPASKPMLIASPKTSRRSSVRSNQAALHHTAGSPAHSTLAVSSFLLIVLAIEATDLIFALDSIPAVLAITRDTFIVSTSNIFAILGLRSLYFALSSALDRLRLLDDALRQDVPGAEGWRWAPEDFLSETFGPDFDPATYLVAMARGTGEYVGLVRVWIRRTGPRLGLMAMLPAFRRTGATRGAVRGRRRRRGAAPARGACRRRRRRATR